MLRTSSVRSTYSNIESRLALALIVVQKRVFLYNFHVLIDLCRRWYFSIASLCGDDMRIQPLYWSCAAIDDASLQFDVNMEKRSHITTIIGGDHRTTVGLDAHTICRRNLVGDSGPPTY